VTGLRVGLILEGTYPYVTGGVSSWAQSLMSQMKDIEFTVIHIGATPLKQEMRYKLPANVREFYCFYLQSITNWRVKKFTKSEKKQLLSVLDDIFTLDKYNRIERLDQIDNLLFQRDLNEIISSKEFWSLILSFYRQSISNQSFTEYYWNIRGMIQPVINCMMSDIPKCDIYHTVTTGYSGIVGISGAVKHSVPLILTEHGIYHREREREIITANWLGEVYKPIWITLFKFISEYVYSKSTLITTLFEKNQLFQRELNAAEDKLRVIPNGINVDRFMELPRKEDKEEFIVGMVGRVVSIKDIKMALRTARLVKDRIKNFKLLIIGPDDEEPDYYRECVALIDAFDLQDTVELTGRQNVLEFYPKMNLLLLTSVSEGQPLVILEALAAGIPVVSTDVGGCSELLYGSSDEKTGACGYIVPPKDYEKAANRIERLYHNDRARGQFRINGEKRVSEKYRQEQMIMNYRNLYQEVLGK
jgi:glycosyltransferase involved in cell wall biosynthesis